MCNVYRVISFCFIGLVFVVAEQAQAQYPITDLYSTGFAAGGAQAAAPPPIINSTASPTDGNWSIVSNSAATVLTAVNDPAVLGQISPPHTPEQHLLPRHRSLHGLKRAA